MHTARRTHGFTESVIRAMTRLAEAHGALNLAQGFPNFPAPDLVKAAAAEAVRADKNQYAITWGARRLREAVASQYRQLYGLEFDPESEVTVTCGATEAMAAVLLALVDPGEEVVILEPHYENYGPDAVLCGARPVFVPLAPSGALDPERLARAFSERTRAVVVNTPWNPAGRVLRAEELRAIADLCRRHDAYAVTDEIYEHIVFEGRHTPLATLPGMRERTVTVSGASKTFAVTGWRIGTVVAPRELTLAIRKVHDFLTVGAPAPLQDAVAVALEGLGEAYYREMALAYRRRRDLLCASLARAGFEFSPPEGAYYVLASYRGLSLLPEEEFARELVTEARVAAVPGSSFFSERDPERRLVRFAFCKTEDVLAEAGRRLEAFAASRGRAGAR